MRAFFRYLPEGTWVPHPQLPATTLQELLARYVDLSAPPSQGMLFLLASCAANNQQAARLSALATVGGASQASVRLNANR